MSRRSTAVDLKAGTIHRISLEDFVTYKQVEIYPGPNLNVIIGPNGTGKSTFVCAIILGLCGKTSVIGRAKKISEFVRSGCQQSTIEIELYQSEGQRNVVITRTFNLEGNTVWSINKRPAKEKNVLEIITTMNIQVDNLCQMLPQDRVQDFAKMDPPQLLRSTLAAAGGHDSLSILDDLIKCRISQRSVDSTVVNNVIKLEELKRLNSRLRSIIEVMEQRKKIEEEIRMCEKKKLWIEYVDMRQKYRDTEKDRKMAFKLVESRRNAMEPLQKSVTRARAMITKIEQGKVTANRTMGLFKSKIQEGLDEIRVHNSQITGYKLDLEEKLSREQTKQREINETRAKLEKLNVDRDNVIREFGGEQDLSNKLAELQQSARRATLTLDKMKKDMENAEREINMRLMPKKRLLEKRKQDYESIPEKRLALLANVSRVVHQAVMWLRSNREQFQHNVYEPMFMELNFSEARYATYLENSVSYRDLMAFIFENAKEMTHFMGIMYSKGWKTVNTLCSPPSNERFQPPVALNQISNLGFSTYMVDSIVAPNAIKRYLCKNYAVHRIPIGNDHTFTNADKVPKVIKMFYTTKHKIRSSTSSYTNETSTTVTGLKRTHLLSLVMDQADYQNAMTELQKLASEEEKENARVRQMNTQLNPLQVSVDQFNSQRKDISKALDKVRSVVAHARHEQRRLTDLVNEPAMNVEAEQQQCTKKITQAILKQMKTLGELTECMKQLHEKKFAHAQWDVKRRIVNENLENKERELRILKEQSRDVEKQLENIDHQLTRLKSEVLDKLKTAKESCNGLLPESPSFPYKDWFEKLPAQLNTLMEHCYELQARVECMEVADERVVKEYEEREKIIEAMELEVHNSGARTKELNHRMERQSRQLMPLLEQMVTNIDTQFSDMFAQLGCAGEVKLDRPNTAEDFDKYGIAILVRFRDGELLQQLTRFTQSGGERALSTALYLMAIQQLTTVPFRCVDEINQGMDPINERKMFQLLVNVTSQCDKGQYFLLTPKLLTSLEYNNQVTIHTVMNGPKINNYREWKFDRFLQNAQKTRISN